MKKIVSTNQSILEVQIQLTPLERVKQNPLKCPLGGELFKDPVTIETGYTFERDQIENHFETYRTCPVTGVDISNISIKIPNQSIKNCVEADLGIPGNLEAQVTDVITAAILKNPFILTSGKSFERDEILRWLDINQTCPETRIPQIGALIPNHTLRVFIKHQKEDIRGEIEEIEENSALIESVNPATHLNITNNFNYSYDLNLYNISSNSVYNLIPINNIVNELTVNNSGLNESRDRTEQIQNILNLIRNVEPETSLINYDLEPHISTLTPEQNLILEPRITIVEINPTDFLIPIEQRAFFTRIRDFIRRNR